MECTVSADLWQVLGTLATFVGVGAALYLGVENWSRDARNRELRRRNDRRVYLTLLGLDIRRLQEQAIKVYEDFNESWTGWTTDERGMKVGVFSNPFSAEHGSLMVLPTIPIMDQTSEWAKDLDLENLRMARLLYVLAANWNEKAASLRDISADTKLSIAVTEDLRLTIENIMIEGGELFNYLTDIAEIEEGQRLGDIVPIVKPKQQDSAKTEESR